MKQIIACLVLFSFAGNAGRSATAIPVQNKTTDNVVSRPLPAYQPLPAVAGKAAIAIPPAIPSAMHRKLRRPAVV